MAASAISRMELEPSDSMVCMCRSPRMSLRTMSVRQRVLGGGFDLAAVFAQLGRDVVEVERVVDLLLRSPRRRWCCLRGAAERTR